MTNATCKSNGRIDFSKPPVGKVYVPIETNEEDIQLSGIDRKYVTRHTYSATTKTVKMVLVDEEYANCGKSYVASIKGDCKKKERRERCRIVSPKTGREIACPYSCYSEECPRKLGLKVKSGREDSIEQMIEEINFEVQSPGSDPTSDAAITGVMRDQFKSLLRKEDPVLATIFEMNDYGYNSDEIMEHLNMASSTFYYQLKRIRNRWKKFNAD